MRCKCIMLQKNKNGINLLPGTHVIPLTVQDTIFFLEVKENVADNFQQDETLHKSIFRMENSILYFTDTKFLFSIVLIQLGAPMFIIRRRPSRNLLPGLMDSLLEFTFEDSCPALVPKVYTYKPGLSDP